MAWRGGKSHISRLACLAGLAVVLTLSLSCTGAAADDDKPSPMTRSGAELVAEMIRKDLDRVVDPMSLKLSRQEKTTIGNLQMYAARRKKALGALWGLFALFSTAILSGLGLFAVSSAPDGASDNRLKSLGTTSMVVGLLSAIGMAPAGAVVDHAELKIAANRKDLKSLFEKRIEKEKNDELKSRLLKRRIAVENGRLVGSNTEQYKHDDLVGKLTTTPDVM